MLQKEENLMLNKMFAIFPMAVSGDKSRLSQAVSRGIFFG
jgi:hypothetical protein